MAGPNSLKRRRIYRACDQCRRRKSKCDGEQPVCTICQQANRACTYETGGGRRGLPSGYVRSLEITLGLIFQHVPSSESTLRGALRDRQNQGNFLKSKVAKQSVSVWRKSKAYRDVSQLLTPGSEDDIFDDSDWEPVESQDHDETMVDNDNAQSSQLSNKLEATMQTLPKHAPQPPLLANLQLPDNTSELVDLYFTYTHCWFPILERRWILRNMHLFNSNGNEQGSHGDSSARIVLCSLIAYTCAMHNISSPGVPSLISLQLAVDQQVSFQAESLELGHIQATLILILTHMATGNINQAWCLVGKTARMMSMLPMPANLKMTRLNHTFKGCVFLDNILSALLDRAPCFSTEEQSIYGPIEEDDLEEWDVWSPSLPGTNSEKQKTPATPMRALSTFNHIHQLTQQLSRILYHPPNSPLIEDFLSGLQTKQGMISRSHPYDRRNSANPPLLNLHLVSCFTTLSFCRRFEPASSVTQDLCARTIHHVLGILDHYRDIAGVSGMSPLTLCFALQCQRSLNISNSETNTALKERISNFIQPLTSVNPGDWKNDFSQPHQLEHMQPPISLNNPISLAIPTALPEISNTATPSLIQDQSSSSLMNPASTGISSSSDFPLLHTLDGTGDAEMYDALFEEMVTSFPVSRQEPSFAHNLGFYDGDLDTDFLAQLQQPPT